MTECDKILFENRL